MTEFVVLGIVVAGAVYTILVVWWARRGRLSTDETAQMKYDLNGMFEANEILTKIVADLNKERVKDLDVSVRQFNLLNTQSDRIEYLENMVKGLQRAKRVAAE